MCLLDYAWSAGQGNAMQEYMPVMPAVKANRPEGASSTPQTLPMKKKSAPLGKSALKQSTLSFGKKPKPMPVASRMSADVVDLSRD